eukprot:3420650-Amphidinium_carterae.1
MQCLIHFTYTRISLLTKQSPSNTRINEADQTRPAKSKDKGHIASKFLQLSFAGQRCLPKPMIRCSKATQSETCHRSFYASN